MKCWHREMSSEQSRIRRAGEHVVSPLQFPVIETSGGSLSHGFRSLNLSERIHITSAAPPDLQASPPVSVSKSAVEASSEREKAQAFEAGRVQGREESREAERQALQGVREAMVKEAIAQNARLLQELADERERYLQAIEPEVVRLALAIAARILRRESQTDPLFLTGAVRVALGELGENTRARVRVPAKEAELWKETMLRLPSVKTRPDVVCDEELQTGDCMIESDVGVANLGVSAQLEEIERELLDTRDGPPSPGTDGEFSA